MSQDSLPIPAQFASGGDFALVDSGIRMRPEWAIALIKLGWWARSRIVPGKRLLIVLLAPKRTFYAQLVALGAVLAGAQRSGTDLTWNQLRTLPVGTELFWKWPTDSRQARGTVEPRDSENDSLVKVRVVAGPRKGIIWSFSRESFELCAFAQEKLPMGAKLASDYEAQQFISKLGMDVPPRWYAAGSPEAVLVTNCAEFDRSLDSVNAALGSMEVPLTSLLSSSMHRDQCAFKLQVLPISSDAESPAPLRILDGAYAFRKLNHECEMPSNVIALLDQVEFNAEIMDEIGRIGASLVSSDPALSSEIADVAAYFEIKIWLASIEV